MLNPVLCVDINECDRGSGTCPANTYCVNRFELSKSGNFQGSTVSIFNSSSTVQDPTNVGAMLDTRKWRTCALTRTSVSSKIGAPREKSASILLEVMSVNVRRVRRLGKVPVSVGIFQISRQNFSFCTL